MQHNNERIEKTATEIKTGKQDYYVTVSDIQTQLQYAFDDLIYGIYVLYVKLKKHKYVSQSTV